MLRYTAPVALTLFLACTVSAQTTRADTDGALDRALAILDRLDEVTASVNYADTPLDEVIEDLNWFLDVPFAADWEALSAMAVDAETEVTLRLEDVPLATVLAAVTLQLGPDFDRPRIEVFDGSMLLLTSEDETDGMRIRDVYDVRDLLADGRAAPELRRTAPWQVDEEAPKEPAATTAPAEPPTASEDEHDADAHVDKDVDNPGRPRPPVRRLTPGEELMTLICEHVDPEAWIEYGGTRASITERDGLLMVSATPTLHRGLRDALRRLRSAYASFVTIDAAIIDVPRDLLDRLTRRHDLSSAALGRALLAAGDASILWRAAAGMTPGAPLAFESQGERGFVTLDLLPTVDRATGILTIAVKAGSRHDDDKRAVSTTVSIPYRQGGATIELPAAAAGDVVRLLVLIPAR